MGPAALLEILVKTAGVGKAVSEITALESSLKRAEASNLAMVRSTAKVSGSFAAAGASARRAGMEMSKGLSLPILAVGAAAGKMASDFQKNMLYIQTQAGASSREVKDLSKQVLNLAKDSAQGPVELSKALYRLEGAGLHGKKAMQALQAASQLAAVGGADVEDTAKTLSQAWFTGIRGAKDFHKVVAELNATVGAGDLRLQQLVDALGVGILPVAKNAGLRLRDITGVLATFGDETNNVSGWTAQLATALHYLYAPTDKAEKALESVGLTGTKLGQDFRKRNGLLTAMTDLRSHLNKLPGGFRGLKAAQVLSQILPGGRGRVLNVLLGQLDRYQQKLKQVGDTTGKFGEAVDKTSKTTDFRFHKALSSIQVALIQLGDHIKGPATTIFEHFAEIIGKVGDWFAKLSPHTQTIVVLIGALVAAAGPAVFIFGALASAIGALLSPVGLIIAALVGLGIGLKAAYDHSATFRNIVDGAFKALQDAVPKVVAAAQTIGGTLVNAFNVAKGAVVAATQWIVTAFNNVVGAVRTAVQATIAEVSKWKVLFAVVNAIVTTIKTVWKVGWFAFGPIVRLAFGTIITIVKGMMAQLANALRTAWGVAKAIFSGAFQAISGITRGFGQALHGVIMVIGGILKGDFGQIWEGVKTIFKGAGTALGGILKGWKTAFVGSVMAIGDGIYKAFKAAFQSVKSLVVGLINDIIDIIDKIPGVHIAHVGGGGVARTGSAAAGGPSGGAGLSRATGKLARGGAFGATGGYVNQPIVMMGEEAPQYPEYVIPTNPAYRKRAQGLLMSAGQAVGFAHGGILSKIGDIAGGAAGLISGGAGALLKLLPSNPLKGPFAGLGSFVLKAGGKYIKDKVSNLLSSVIPGGGGAPIGPVGKGGVTTVDGIPVASWIARILKQARADGVQFRVSSGYRSLAEQTMLWNKLGHDRRIVAAPGTSNHEGSAYPRGAVDIGSGWQNMVAWLAKHPNIPLHHYTEPRDPYHFSATGHRRGGIIKRFQKGGVNGNVRTAWQFLRGKGLTPAQVAGIIGWMQGESGQGLSTTATNPGSGAYGIAQWLGPRKAALMKRGNPTSLSTQLNFLWSELQGSESGAYKQIKGAHTIADAVHAWGAGFERPGPGEWNLPARNANAQRVFKALQNVSGATGGGAGSTSTGGAGATGPSADALQRKIAANQDRIDKLRQQVRHLPTGKKGHAQRVKLQDQISTLLTRNRHIRDQIKNLPKGADDTPTPMEQQQAAQALALAQTMQRLGVTDLTQDAFTNPDTNVYNWTGAKQAAKALLPQQKAQEARIRKVTDALKKKNLTPKTRVRLQQELADLIPQHQALVKQRKDLLTAPSDPNGPATQEDILNMQLAQAQLTPDTSDDAAANAAILDYRKGVYLKALQGGDPRQITQAAQDLKEAMDANTSAQQDQTDAIKAHTDALNAVRDQMKKQTDIATAVQSVENFQLQKMLADLVASGLGASLTQKSFMPSTGLAAY